MAFSITSACHSQEVLHFCCEKASLTMGCINSKELRWLTNMLIIVVKVVCVVLYSAVCTLAAGDRYASRRHQPTHGFEEVTFF